MAKVNVPFMIGRRYSRAKRRNGFISFISAVSMVGIALGVMVLIIVISIMNGFGNELRGRILDVTSHVTITGLSGSLEKWQELAPTVNQHEEVEAYAPYIYSQGLLNGGGIVTGAVVRGVDPRLESKVSAIANSMQSGDFDKLTAGNYNIVLGDLLANKLRLRIGDKVTLISPKGQSSPAGLLPRLKRFTLVGTFFVDMNEYDANMALVHIDDASKLLKMGSRVHGLRLKLNDAYVARQVAAELDQQLDFHYVDNWTRQHENFFRALEIERRVMFIILFLIVVVAAVNIVSTLVMVVTDKQADIAILRTVGMSPRGIMGVFFVQGAMSGFIGTVIGAVLGILVALNIGTIIPFIENLVGYQLFPADVYVITNFPAELRWGDVGIIVSVSLAISMLATLFPAWRASKTQPAEALRYE